MQPILVPQTSRYFCILRLVSVFRYGQLHVAIIISIIEHFWSKSVVDLRHLCAIDNVVKLLLKVRVVLIVLCLILLIRFGPVVSQVLLFFEPSTDLHIEFVDASSDVVGLLLEVGDALYSRS